jgi:hypothetical protein
MSFDRWQAPDRDSPTAVKFDANVELGQQLEQLLQMEGHAGTKEEQVLEVTGKELNRPRRWHKIFERMGLMFQDESGTTKLTDLGKSIKAAKDHGGRQFRRTIAGQAVTVLRKYQLKNPADEEDDSYPDGTDLHPYWAIWKAAVELGGKLHWEELNRVLMWVLKHSDLDAAIANIKAARAKAGYDPEKDGSPAARLGPRAHDQDTAPEGKDPNGQIRDQKTTPWFKRAGLNELILTTPGRGGGGYWSVHPDIRDLIEKEIRRPPPPFKKFNSESEWFDYFGRIEEGGATKLVLAQEEEKYTALVNDLPDDDPVWAKVKELVDSGSIGVILSGPPGTSKTWYARRIAAKLAQGRPENVCFIQFHPSYSYDDFVEGYVAEEGHGTSRFVPKKKVFLKFCDEARGAADQLHILVVDELNRGDPSKIFGELLTYIERDYRNQNVTLAYSGTQTSIPQNIFIIATMNPYDKSVVDLDDALERRFDRIALDPSVDILRGLLTKSGMAGELLGKTVAFFVSANGRSSNRIGHAFFQGMKTETDLQRLWNHKLRFILEKMFRFEPESMTEMTQSYDGIFVAPATVNSAQADKSTAGATPTPKRTA